MDSRVYRFGVVAIDPQSEEILYQELKGMHTLRNQLVQIERTKRDQRRELYRIANPALERLNLQYEDLEKQYRHILENELSGVLKKDRPPEWNLRLKAIEDQQKELSKKYKDLRDETKKKYFESDHQYIQDLLAVIVDQGKLPQAVLKRTFQELNLSDIKALKKAVVNLPEEGALLKDDETFQAYRKAAVDTRPKKTSLFPTTLLGPNDGERHAAKAKSRQKLFARKPRTKREKLLQRWYRIGIQAEQESKDAKDNSTLGSEDSALVFKAAEASFSKSVFQPKFVLNDGQGQVGAQLKKTSKGYLTVEAAFECQDTRLRIQKYPDGEDLHLTNYSKTKKEWRLRKPERFTGGARRRMKIRKGTCLRHVAKVSLQLKENVILHFDVLLHRPMPESAQIRYAYLSVKKIGTRTALSLDLTLNSDVFDKPKAGPNVPTAAINLGWRLQNDGSIRVATIYDGSKSSHIILPPKYLEGVEKKRALQKICDRIFNAEKTFFRTWLHENPMTPELRSVLEAARCWGRDYDSKNYTLKSFRTHVLHCLNGWRSHKSLVWVAKALASHYLAKDTVYRWNHHRLPKPKGVKWKAWRTSMEAKGIDPLDLFPTKDIEGTKIVQPTLDLSKWKPKATSVENLALHLALWGQKDRHVFNWAREMEARLRLWRQEIYRRETYKLYQTFQRIIIEDWDKTKTARRKPVSDGGNTPQEEHAQTIRQSVGVYRLTLSLKDKFGKNNVVVVNPKGVSIQHNCKKRGSAKRVGTENVMLQCRACGMNFDQDIQAAKNLYWRYYEVSSIAAE